jgi:hypothetical protein
VHRTSSLVLAAAAFLSACGLLAPEPTLDIIDASDAGLAVAPIADVTGLIDESTARAVVLADYNPPDPDVRLDLFLRRVTVPSAHIRDVPAWIARYSGLDGTTPGGHIFHIKYNLFDARTGQYLVGLIGGRE